MPGLSKTEIDEVHTLLSKTEDLMSAKVNYQIELLKKDNENMQNEVSNISKYLEEQKHCIFQIKMDISKILTTSRFQYSLYGFLAASSPIIVTLLFMLLRFITNNDL